MRASLAGLLALAAVFTQSNAAPIVTGPGGVTITGTVENNTAGHEVNVFRGIPYAQAPVGDLRWKQTTLKPLSGSLNATDFGNACMGNAPPSSEDCLFLNVYTPAGVTSKSKLPVMLWIHGGGFVGGSSNRFIGANLVGAADQKIVYVSINYRVGIFGFMSNKDILAQGDGANFGLRDQEVAFQWVKKYIKYFGGNPKDITAFGQSAGSMSIAMHMIARNGKQNYFQKAVMESGVHTTAHDATSVSLQANYTATVASGVGCAPGDADVMSCLRNATADAVLAAGRPLNWKPTVDNVYLLDVPIHRVKQGKISAIPTMVGTNTDEGWGFASAVSEWSQFDSFVRTSYPLMTETEYARVDELYPAENFPSAHHRAAEVFGDIIFVCPSEMFSLALATRQQPPTYRFRFNQTTIRSGFPTAIHSDEYPYIFEFATVPTDAGSKSLVKTMQKFWVNFANTASPNSATEQTASAWPVYDAEAKQQIVLQTSPTTETTGAYMPLHDERCAFWYGVDERLAALVDK